MCVCVCVCEVIVFSSTLSAAVIVTHRPYNYDKCVVARARLYVHVYVCPKSYALILALTRAPLFMVCINWREYLSN